MVDNFLPYSCQGSADDDAFTLVKLETHKIDILVIKKSFELVIRDHLKYQSRLITASIEKHRSKSRRLELQLGSHAITETTELKQCPDADIEKLNYLNFARNS